MEVILGILLLLVLIAGFFVFGLLVVIKIHEEWLNYKQGGVKLGKSSDGDAGECTRVVEKGEIDKTANYGSKGEREFISLVEKFNRQVEGKKTYHLCNYCLQLAKFYMRGKYVERDPGVAEFLCDSAIEYAEELYSIKTRDRKIQEYTIRRKQILGLDPAVIGDDERSMNIQKTKPKLGLGGRLHKDCEEVMSMLVASKTYRPKANISKYL